MTREKFEEEFHQRTLAYIPGFNDSGLPLVVKVADEAHTPAGHALLISLANQTARAHRSLAWVGDLDRPLLCRDPFQAVTLEHATLGLAQAINPFIEVASLCSMPSIKPLLTIAIGPDTRADLVVGAEGWKSTFNAGGAIGDDETSIWGALLASCLAANAAFHQLTGFGGLPHGVVSLWDPARPEESGPSAVPLDLGRVLQVGAGAVGSGLDFFVSFFGHHGDWLIVDGDVVDVTNLNRQIAFVARDAGFPEGPAANKAECAADLLGGSARFSPLWYGEDLAVVNGKYDVLLGLANERGVRSFLQGRQPTVLLHSTTSPNWQAQFHRHVAGTDDCVDCRIPPDMPRFTCDVEEVETQTGEKVDAAVPPLSAIASLLLAASAARLQAGRLLDSSRNFVALELFGGIPSMQAKTRHCREGCITRRPPELRRMIDAHSRWLHLDSE